MVSKLTLPLWLVSVLLFVGIYALELVVAAATGALRQFASDVRWLGFASVPATTAFILGYAPSAMTRLWASIRPWLANSETDILDLQTVSRRVLTRLFWLGALVWGVYRFQYVVFPQFSWATGLYDP